MPTRESIIADATFKEIEEIDRRVFATLTAVDSLQQHRLCKAFALLVGRLHDSGELSSDDMDDLLYRCVT